MSKGACQCASLQCMGECILKNPKVNSCMRHVYCMQELQRSLPKVAKDKICVTAKPCQITKMVNFRNTQTVFNNLIPLNVNDSFVWPKKSVPPKKVNCSTNKMPAPNLHDYLKPVEPLVNIVCEPDINPQCHPRDIDVCSSYNSFIE